MYDDDILLDDSFESDETSDSDLDSTAEDDQYRLDMLEDERIEEADKLQDHLYEEELMTLFEEDPELKKEEKEDVMVGEGDGAEEMMLDDGEVAMEGEDIDLEKDLDAIEGMTVRIGVVGDTIDEEDEED